MSTIITGMLSEELNIPTKETTFLLNVTSVDLVVFNFLRITPSQVAIIDKADCLTISSLSS